MADQEFFLKVIVPAMLFSSAFGLVSPCWAIYRFYNEKFLKTVPGVIIISLGWYDFYNAGLYAAFALYSAITKTQITGDNPIWLILLQVWDWILLSSAMAGLSLAGTALYIICFNGNVSALRKKLWILLAFAIIWPLISYFGIYSVIENSYTFRAGRWIPCQSSLCNTFPPFNAFYIAIACSYVLLMISVYLCHRRIILNGSRSSAVLLMMRILRAYSAVATITWIPLLVYYFILKIEHITSGTLFYSIVFLYSLLCPARSFFHLMALYYTLREYPNEPLTKHMTDGLDLRTESDAPPPVALKSLHSIEWSINV